MEIYILITLSILSHLFIGLIYQFGFDNVIDTMILSVVTPYNYLMYIIEIIKYIIEVSFDYIYPYIEPYKQFILTIGVVLFVIFIKKIQDNEELREKYIEKKNNIINFFRKIYLKVSNIYKKNQSIFLLILDQNGQNKLHNHPNLCYQENHFFLLLVVFVY